MDEKKKGIESENSLNDNFHEIGQVISDSFSSGIPTGNSSVKSSVKSSSVTESLTSSGNASSGNATVLSNAANNWKSWCKTAIEELRSDLDPQIFQAYIRPLQFSDYDHESDELHIVAPSRFVCHHVNAHYKRRLQKSFAGSFGKKLELRLSVESPSETIIPPTTGDDKNTSLSEDEDTRSKYIVVKKLRQRKTPSIVNQSSSARSKESWNSGIHSRYTFQNFVVGSGNQFCHAAAQQVAENPGLVYNPLFVYGGVGLGKTHLLHAIGNAVLLSDPSKRVLYLSSETFTNELILSLRNAKMDEFKKKLRGIDVLLIDDIQFMRGKERTQEEFFHTFNTLYGEKHQIVITSDKMPQEIPGIEERLQTRFSWGLTADIQAPDYETRVAILEKKALADKFIVPEEVIHLIAENISSNVRELEGALTRLHAKCSLLNIEITKDLAESALKPLLRKKKVHLTIVEIQKVVAKHFGITVTEMTSKRRTKNLSFPRHVAMYLCRKHTTSSYPEIGSKFGGRDHSSVIHAANVVTTKVKDSQDVRNHIRNIEDLLFQGE